jgi:uncharacterized membrane protein YhaH (DUF805 family)
VNLVLNVLLISALAVSQGFQYYPNHIGPLSALFGLGALSYILIAVIIATFLSAAATTRRLRDAGFSPYLQFLYLLPLAPLAFVAYFSAYGKVLLIGLLAFSAFILAIGVWITMLVLVRKPSKS